MPPGNSRQRLETVLVVRTAGMLLHLVEPRAAAEYPTVHRAAPPIKNYLVQYVSSATVERL